MTPQERILASYIQARVRGVTNARPAGEIRGALLAMGLALDRREFAAATQNIALETGDLGSSDAGYFWCVDEADYDAAYSYIVTRFEPMRDRAERIKRRKAERFQPAKALFEVW